MKGKDSVITRGQNGQPTAFCCPPEKLYRVFVY
jgi:hypothetical protein